MKFMIMTITVLLLLSLIPGYSFLYANAPLQPEKPVWVIEQDVVTDEISFTINASTANPVTGYQVRLYKGEGSPVHEYVAYNYDPAITENHENIRVDLSAEMQADFNHEDSENYESYYVIVTAINNAGNTESPESPKNSKGLASLPIIGIVANEELSDFIFNRHTANETFQFDSENETYNYMIRYDVEGIDVSLPESSENDPNKYIITAHYYDDAGDIDETYYDESAETGRINIPMITADGSAGRDVDGLPDGTENNNVIVIEVNPGDGYYSKAYTIRLRRRAVNLATGISNILPAPESISANTDFSADLTSAVNDINGDDNLSYEKIFWQVIAETGTAYFDDNTLNPLSNGTILVTARTTDGSNLSVTSSASYTIESQSNWLPHLGKIELSEARDTSNKIAISPYFSSDPYKDGLYTASVLGEYSAVELKTMAPSGSILHLNGVRVSNNATVTLRLQPKTVSAPYNVHTLKVEIGGQTKTYTIRIERDVTKRLIFGVGGTDEAPYLAAPLNEDFGINDQIDKITVQAWVRWTVDPPSIDPHRWATIATLDRPTSDRGHFWLQHTQTNTEFEFAVRTVNSETGEANRRHIRSTTVPQKGVWYHVTGVYDSERVRIYVNGVEERSISLTDSFATWGDTNMWIGRSPSTNARLFVGNIRDVRLWVGTARSAQDILDDYNGFTPNPAPNFCWALNETAPGDIATAYGNVDLTMENTDANDFISCCENNMKPGQVFAVRPLRIDLSSSESQSAIYINASGYTSTEPKFSLLGMGDDAAFEIWDHTTKEWVTTPNIEAGVLFKGNPVIGTGFWIPIRKGSGAITNGKGRFVDDYSTPYGTPDVTVDYNSIFPLPEVTPMTLNAIFSISGTLIGTQTYPTTAKYIVIGYDQVEGGTLITATSTETAAGRIRGGAGSFTLVSDESLKRIEFRTLDDILIKILTNQEGWDEDTILPDQTPLPVELTSLTAITTADLFVHIKWTSETETNLLGYNVYRSIINSLNDSFKINHSMIDAQNSSETTVYDYIDSDVVSGQYYYYWLQAVDLDLTHAFYGPVSILVSDSVEEEATGGIPLVTELTGAYPNPFNPPVTISFSLKEAARVRISVFNLSGQLVRTVTDSYYEKPGRYSVLWDGKDRKGRFTASGIYFYRMEVTDHEPMVKKMLQLK